MKKKLLNGLEKIVRDIGKSIKRNAKLSLFLAGLTLGVSNVEASPGSIVIGNNIEYPYTNGDCSIVHRPENLGAALEGIDSHDVSRQQKWHSMRHEIRRGLQVFSCMQENT